MANPKTTVKVAQPSGEITVTFQGWRQETFQVSDHKVQIDERDLEEFLAANEGSAETGRASAKESPKS